MKVTQMPPVHATSPVANSGSTAYRVDVTAFETDIRKMLAILIKHHDGNKLMFNQD